MKKTCFKCGLEKNINEFYKHKGMSDGRLNKCKDCAKKDVSENYLKNRDYYLEYDKKRNSLPHRVKGKEKYDKSKRGKEVKKDITNRWRKKHPNQMKAMDDALKGIKKGIITKPKKCTSCKQEKRLCAHHHDYSKPLDVVFFCDKCHREWHNNNEALNRDLS